MHDLNEIFKEQLANEKPWTEKTIRASVGMYAHHLTARELMAKSKELKSKIGKRRLLYYLVKQNAMGGASKPVMEKVWDDEFDQLQTILADYMFMGMDGQIPKFAHKDIK